MTKDKMTGDEAALILHHLKQDMLTGAVRKFKSYNNEELMDPLIYDALNFAFEAIKQKSKNRYPENVLNHLIGAEVLDKIRTEIIQLPTISFNMNDIYKADVLAIIDKYKL